MDDREESLLDSLKAHGYRLTKPRQAVIRALATAVKPMTVADIHAEGRRYCAELGLVTVYRTVEMLLALGQLHIVHLDAERHGYALASPGHVHHLVCSRCRRIIEVTGCTLDGFLDDLAERTGYRITGHRLEIAGICPECRAKFES